MSSKNKKMSRYHYHHEYQLIKDVREHSHTVWYCTDLWNEMEDHDSVNKGCNSYEKTMIKMLSLSLSPPSALTSCCCWIGEQESGCLFLCVRTASVHEQLISTSDERRSVTYAQREDSDDILEWRDREGVLDHKNTIFQVYFNPHMYHNQILLFSIIGREERSHSICGYVQ